MLELVRGLPANFWPKPCKRLQSDPSPRPNLSTVSFAGILPGIAGAVRINYQIPANAPTGAQQLVVTVGACERMSERSKSALREARRSVITHSPALAKCGKVLRVLAAAEEAPSKFLPIIHKMIETIENDLGGEKALVNISRLTEVERLKKLANVGAHDERHDPDSNEMVRPKPDDVKAEARLQA